MSIDSIGRPLSRKAGRGTAVIGFLALFFFLAGWAFPADLAAAEEGKPSLEQLLTRFSECAQRTESDRILEEILRRLKEFSASGRFSTGSHYVRQLEPSRMGRTFSLSRFPEKQDQDAQLFRIRTFIADFYQAWAEFHRGQGLSKQAEMLTPAIERYQGAIQRTKKWLGNRPESALECFEDDQASTPFPVGVASSQFIPVPTTLFLTLPSGVCFGLPFIPPFSFQQSQGATSDVALNPAWTWYIGNWRGISQTLIAGLSPLGHQLVWVAGALSGDRSLTCTMSGGRWVITAGEPNVAPAAKRWSLASAGNPDPGPPDPEPLKSRGMAGFSFRALTKSDIASFTGAPGEGVFVRDVFPDTPASRAGIEPGDILVEYDGVRLSGESRLYDVIQGKYAGEEVSCCLWRQGKQLRKSLTLMEAPREAPSDLSIEYTSFPVENIRLRAVIVSPRESDGKPLPGLFIVSALGSPRLRQFPGLDLQRELAYEAARKGWRVMRFEQRGSGDSEGQDFRTSDFQSEHRDNQAGLEYFFRRPDVDPNRVFVFGHSTGGIISALLAGTRPVAGLIVSGTWGRSFFERVLDTIRLQGTLAGSTVPEIDRSIKEFAAIFSELLTDRPLDQILKERPELSRFVNANGRLMDDRTADYWRQKLRLNLAEVYAAIKCPTLILYNSCDFITTRTCHEWIQTVLTGAGNSAVTLRIIDRADHRYALVDDFAHSHRTYRTGGVAINPEPIRVIVAWLAEWLAGHPQPGSSGAGEF